MPRGVYKRGKKVPEVVKVATPKSRVKLMVEIPPNGVDIKITNGKGMIGTLVVDCDGMTFVPANAKVRGKTTPWQFVSRFLNWNVN